MLWELQYSVVGDRKIFDAVLGTFGLAVSEHDGSLWVHGAALDAMPAAQVHAFGRNVAGRLTPLGPPSAPAVSC